MKKVLLGLLLLALVVGVGVGAKRLYAASGDSMRGWLWGGSENPFDGVLNGNETGLGWLSVNDLDCDDDTNGYWDVDCGGNNSTTAVIAGGYGVNVPSSDGAVTGVAWYGNSAGAIDWLVFNPAGDLAKYPGCGYPTAPCQSVQRSGDNLVGWARFAGIARDYALFNSGGWEGWVRMQTVQLNPVTNAFSGFAWHGEQIAAGIPQGYGWIDFKRAKLNGTPTVKVCPPGGLTLAAGSVGGLTAYFKGDTFSCGDTGATNITNDSGTTWDTSNESVAKVVFGGTVTAISQVGSPAQVSATYNGITSLPVPVSVTCVEPACGGYPDITKGWCPNETRDTGKDLCDGNPLLCPGTRLCDFNQIETGQ